MKYIILWILMLGFISSLSAQVWNEYDQHTMALGIHYLLHSMQPGDNIIEYLFMCSRLGIKCEYMYNFSGVTGLGAEIIIDTDLFTFLVHTHQLKSEIKGIYEITARILFSYNTYLFKIIPLFGARVIAISNHDVGCYWEAGLRFAFRIRHNFEFEACGCGCFLSSKDFDCGYLGNTAMGFKYCL